MRKNNLKQNIDELKEKLIDKAKKERSEFGSFIKIVILGDNRKEE